MRTLKDRLRKQANKPKLKKPAPMTFQVELKSWRTGCELTQDAAATLSNGEGALVVLAGKQTAGRGRLGRTWTQRDRLGLAVTFTVAASGSPAPSYQWSKNGTTLNGATSPTLSPRSRKVSAASARSSGASSTRRRRRRSSKR